jgi:hypothetical protein
MRVAMGGSNEKQLVDVYEKEWKTLIMDLTKSGQRCNIRIPVTNTDYHVYFAVKYYFQAEIMEYCLHACITKYLPFENSMLCITGGIITGNLAFYCTERCNDNTFDKYFDEIKYANRYEIIRKNILKTCAFSVSGVAKFALHHVLCRYVEHNMKQLLLVSIMEYLCDANNYKNNKTVSKIERVFADEYVVKCISKY